MANVESNSHEAVTAPPQSELDRAATPQLISPPDTRTPPTVTHKRHIDRDQDDAHKSSGGRTTGVDASALSTALRQVGRQRERTPGLSPKRKRPRVYGDRFIPERVGVDLHSSFNLLEDNSPTTPSKSASSNNELNFQRVDEANRTYSNILRSEMFDSPAVPSSSDLDPSTPRRQNLFSFRSNHPTPIKTPRSMRGPSLNPNSELYSVSPLKLSSQKMLVSPRKQPRSVSKVPFKVLDAPELADDFYLNLVDWGNQNILGVGLGSCVYTWNSSSGRVTKLLELKDDNVTSVNWIQRGSHIAVGTNRGFVQIWDASTLKRVRTMTGHTSRVGALAWNQHILTSGSRDRLIYHRDVRQPEMWLRKLAHHKQEVCGLKWNPDDGQLASGGNDNNLMVWDKLSSEPMFKWKEHQAAVKAIAWSPHQRGLLASGGGTADRNIKFWNTLISPYAPSSISRAAQVDMDTPNDPITPANLINSIDTNSQVCNLAWSINSNELVSTHGYSQNQIVVWKYPSMQQVVSLTGHTFRVLYLAMSPSGETIVTGAGDETLRFWNCFKKKTVKTFDDFSRAGSSEIIR